MDLRVQAYQCSIDVPCVKHGHRQWVESLRVLSLIMLNSLVLWYHLCLGLKQLIRHTAAILCIELHLHPSLGYREQAKTVRMQIVRAVNIELVACILNAHNSVSAFNACFVMVGALVACMHFQCAL